MTVSHFTWWGFLAYATLTPVHCVVQAALASCGLYFSLTHTRSLLGLLSCVYDNVSVFIVSAPVMRGRVVVESKDAKTGEVFTLMLQEGSFFGEAAMVNEAVRARRNASVKAVDMCHLFRLSAGAYREAITDFPEYANLLKVRLAVRWLACGCTGCTGCRNFYVSVWTAKA